MHFLRLLTLTCLLGMAAGSHADEVPSFRYDIMPLLSRTGCNMGACHGSANGKGNLKLSLRGENPDTDFATLTQNRQSKRLNTTDPDTSFLLRKPAKLTEHEGGLRIAPDSTDYQLLRRWIAAGAPRDPDNAPVLTALSVDPPEATVEAPALSVQLKVTATFSDGTTRDVTRESVYEAANLLVDAGKTGHITARQHGETTIMVRYTSRQQAVPLLFLPHRPDYRWDDSPEHNFIDTHVFAKLRRVRALPSPLSDDVTFLRRVFFDLIGLPPTREEAERFLTSTAPDKRAALIDTLLERPEFADWWALKWADLLRLEERVLDTTGTAVMHRWIRDSIQYDKPLDLFARELLTALGSTYQHGPANFYRALREPTLRSETAAQLFLGTRLACAKCHNHPFERWTQDDYYRFAALFDGIDTLILQNRRTDENDKQEFVGEQVVHLVDKRELKDPRTGKHPAPGLIGDGAPTISSGPQRLEEAARWITSPTHPLFAKVQTNRIWAHLLGRGIVDPVDDFRFTNPPSIPPLLDALAARFVEEGFRLKPLVRLICNSRTYQLSAEPNATNAGDDINFPRALIRRHSAESLLDAIHAALGAPLENSPAFPDATRATQIPGARFITKSRRPTDAERFLKEFGKPPRSTACDCERTNASSLSQIFTLTSGPGLHKLLRQQDNHLARLLSSATPTANILADLYWRTLSRPPTAAESARLLPLLKDNPDPRPALEDITWSLLNTKEFLLRR